MINFLKILTYVSTVSISLILLLKVLFNPYSGDRLPA